MKYPELVNPTKFAAETGLSITHVYSLIKAGKLKIEKREKGLRIINLIYSSEIEKFKKNPER